MLDTDGSKPIYIQIAEWIETEIIDGSLRPMKKYILNINLRNFSILIPRPLEKDLTLLVEEEIVYKDEVLVHSSPPMDERNCLQNGKKKPYDG